MTERTISLTPECYKTWIIRPGLFLLYDRVIFDKKDYNRIVSMQEASTYDYLIHRNIELFKKEWLVEIVDYEEILSAEERREIHNEAEKFVSELTEREITSLSLHAYQEYKKYLKDKLKFYHLDEPKYEFELRKLQKVINGLKEIEIIRENPKRYIEALKRITAKIIAGLTFISKYHNETLHDTNEYKPFFAKHIITKDITKVSFEAKNENFKVRRVIALLLNKPYPTIEIYDEISFYEFMIIRQEFSSLKKLMTRIEKLYGELLDTNRNTVFEELKKEIMCISNECDKEFQRLKSKYPRKILWGLFEQIGSKFIPLFKIFLDPLCRKNDELLRREIEKKVVNKNSLGGNLYLLYKDIESKKPQFELPILKKYNHQAYSDIWIWGEDNSILPWYER